MKPKKENNFTIEERIEFMEELISSEKERIHNGIPEIENKIAMMISILNTLIAVQSHIVMLVKQLERDDV